jgi:pantoate--beta-alanine ligase
MLSILSTQHDLKNYIADKIAEGKTIGFVPTMGALHEGHLTLARQALAENDECIVSIFVNPKQFAPHEDFDKYPRTLDKDSALLEDIGVQSIFAPSVDVMYPPAFQSSVTVGNISKPLEGEFRPHFFTGVATVVTRLLLLVGAHKAYFGEKDYQQLQVIKALQRDLAIATDIIGVPTVREASGLALSSRNAYLSPAQKDQALTIIQTLRSMVDDLKSGQAITQIEAAATEKILSAGFDKVDYITIRDAETLLPPTPTTKSHRLLAAAWLGQTRLIDNIEG